MKKIASILIILLMACCFVFATEATVKLNGTVPEGYTGGDDDPVAQNGGLKLIMKVVTSTSETPSDPQTYKDGEDAGTSIANVDIVHAGIDDGINSLYIAFGAYGNVPKDDNTASLDVTVESEGWKDSENVSMDGILKLEANTNKKTHADKLFTGAAGVEGVSFSVNTSTSYTGESRIVEKDAAILVGFSKVSWGLAGDTIPPTGEYTGTITITITGDDGATV